MQCAILLAPSAFPQKVIKNPPSSHLATFNQLTLNQAFAQFEREFLSIAQSQGGMLERDSFPSSKVNRQLPTMHSRLFSCSGACVERAIESCSAPFPFRCAQAP